MKWSDALGKRFRCERVYRNSFAMGGSRFVAQSSYEE